MTRSQRVAGMLGTLIAGAAAGACGGADHYAVAGGNAPGGGAVAAAAPAKAAAAARLRLTVNEFSIAPYAATVRGRRVKITVTNRGKQAHELLVVRANGKLPLKGQRIDEAALERAHRIVGEVSDVKPGKSRAKTFAMKKGSYMLFCNLPHHYDAGMRGTLVVRG